MVQMECKTRCGWVEIVLEIKIWLYYLMVYPQTKIHPRKWIFWDLGIETDHLISARRQEFVLINKKMLSPSGFRRSSGPLSEIKESKKINKYLDLAEELKKSCGTLGWPWYQL